MHGTTRHPLLSLFRPLVLASLLVAAGCASIAPPHPGTAIAVDPVSSPDWARDMARFAAEDRAHPPPAHPVVFTGSSSIRMWSTLAADFPGIPVLNRGFGGSQLRDAVHYADALALQYQPRRILLYSGDNDIDAGRTPEQVLHDFRAFVATVRKSQPHVAIDWLSIKPSPARITQLAAQRRANALVRDEIARMHGVRYIDVATPLLDAGGLPRRELFGPDGLHMNASGYALWRQVLAPLLP